MPGIYTACLQIMDTAFNNICSSTFCDSVIVTGVNCNNLALSVAAVNATCATCNDGSATVAATGGTPPFTYLWNTSATTQTIANLLPGTYTCCITDAVGCTACAGATVNGNTPCSSYFTLTASIVPHTYTGVNLATGTPPIQYMWSWGDATYSYTATPTHTYASAGFYTICLTVTDTLSCTATYCDTFTLLRMETANAMITVNVVWPSATAIPMVNSPEGIVWVYPNPAKNELAISNGQNAINAVGIYDVYGKLCQSLVVSGQSSSAQQLSPINYQQTIDVSKLSPGIYFVKVKGENEERIAKFVKE
jgi:PKD repeat protein